MGCGRGRVNDVLAKVRKAGLNPYVYHYKGGSAYIKFDENVGGSLRISDHPQKARYAYRWNLRTDLTEQETKTKRGHVCFYYPIADLEDMISDMKFFLGMEV